MMQGGIIVGIGWCLGVRTNVFPAPHAAKMCVEGLGRGKIAESFGGGSETLLEKTTPASGIDEEPGGQANRFACALSAKEKASRGPLWSGELRLVEVLDVLSLGFANQEMIEIGAVPVRICDVIVWAGRDQQLIGRFGRVSPGQAKGMMVKGETSFQAAGNLGVGLLPGAPLSERKQTGESIAMRQFFEQQIGQGS